MKLENVIVLWNCNKFDDSAHHPNGIVTVIEKGRYVRSEHDKYANSCGSCFLSWKNADDRERMFELLSYLMNMVVNDKIEFATVHNEFMRISEYREYCKDPQVWIADNR
jgi:hypothetical protein